MKKTYLSILTLVILCSCNKNNYTEESASIQRVKISFGSCNDEDKEQKLWDDILNDNPDYWVWLGDNIYGDSEDMSVIRAKYNLQKSNLDYKKLMANSVVTGVWDDHDYGYNDSGKYFPAKVGSQKEFLDFLDVPANDPRRSREGIYTSIDKDYGWVKIKIILLDARYFRDDPIKENNQYHPNLDGTILGNAQWAWLEKELEQSTADVHIIASGIQIIPEEHRFEKWSNFPMERLKLFNMLNKYEAKRPVFISGDRHIGEISSIEFDQSVFYDLTSSSLTHGWDIRKSETNKHRMGNIVYDINYGLIEIINEEKIKIKSYLKTDNSKVVEQATLFY